MNLCIQGFRRAMNSARLRTHCLVGGVARTRDVPHKLAGERGAVVLDKSGALYGTTAGSGDCG